jgi:lipopolysaccharide assembly protein A
MVRFLRLSLGVVALIVIMAFAIANRTPVTVGLAPLPGTIELPVYGVFLLGLVIGVLVGGIGVGLGAIPKRREARRMRNKAWALENQLSVIRGQQERREAERYAQRSLPAQGAGA